MFSGECGGPGACGGHPVFNSYHKSLSYNILFEIPWFELFHALTSLSLAWKTWQKFLFFLRLMKAKTLRFLGSRVQNETVETFTVAKCSCVWRQIVIYHFFSGNINLEDSVLDRCTFISSLLPVVARNTNMERRAGGMGGGGGDQGIRRGGFDHIHFLKTTPSFLKLQPILMGRAHIARGQI